MIIELGNETGDFYANPEYQRSFLFVTYALGGGGAERAMLRFANALARRGHVVCIYSYERLDTEYEVAEGVCVRYSQLSRISGDAGKLEKYIEDARAVRSLFYQRHFDYVIPFCTEMVICTYFGLLGMHGVLVATERNNPIDGCRGRIKRLIRDGVYSRCSAIWTQNEAQASHYRRLTNRNVFVIPNIVEMTPKVNNPNGEIRRFMTIGRLADQKNQRMMIEGFAKALKVHPNITLDIFGDGPLKEELGELIHSLGVEESISLKGFCADVYRELDRHDAFCFTSNYEGLPNALIEAVLTELPVVTTAFETGSREIIANGATGHLVDCGDTEAFTLAVCEMVEEPAEAFRMARTARIGIEKKYCESSLVDSLLTECERLRHE
nr:glycosyltransferase [uncultured Collinsella sp.]